MTVSLVRYQPFTGLRRALDSLFDERFFAPYRFFTLGPAKITPIDMYYTDSELVVKAALPGVKPEEIEVSISGDTLTIKGETKAEEKIEREGYLYQEHQYGAFYRSVVVLRVHRRVGPAAYGQRDSANALQRRGHPAPRCGHGIRLQRTAAASLRCAL